VERNAGCRSFLDYHHDVGINRIGEFEDTMKLTLKDQQVLVLGLGDTGLSALRWLKRQGALLSVADTRQVPPGVEAVRTEMPEVKMHLGEFNPEVLIKTDLIVISPGVALAEPMVQAAIAQGVKVVGDVELFAQNKPAKAKVIAITGSNGKSTVTTMAGDICKAAGMNTVVAGNIGLPVLDTLSDEVDVPDVYVLELSSFQLETTSSLNADASTVLNISEDHMDRYDSFANYAAAKNRIFAGHGVQVLNRQDAWSMGMAIAGRPMITFGLDAPKQTSDFGLIDAENAAVLVQGDHALLDMGDLKVAGSHNAANALAAMALCQSVGVPEAPMLQALRSYQGLSHRVEWVANINHKRVQIIAALEESLRHGLKVHSSRLLNEMNTFVYINGRPDHMKGQHDDLIMSLAMAIYVSDSSFSQLTKVTQQAKTMLESWTVQSHEPPKDQYFNPSMPNTNVRDNPVYRNQPSQKDYEQYLWLFGGMKR
jgi:UDP-N-acetylmuramoylalanine--D-glutamate ligase